MATNRTIRGISGRGFRVPNSASDKKTAKEGVSVVVDVDERLTSLILSREKDNFVRTKEAGTVTVNLGTDVFSKAGHGFLAGDIVTFSTTGALPTGVVAGTKYYVIASGLTADVFKVSATLGGATIDASGSQSGTHTVTPASVRIVGISRNNSFVIRNTAGDKVTVKLTDTPTVHSVDLTDGRVTRVLKRNAGRYVASSSATAVTLRGLQNPQNGFDVKGATGDSSGVLTSDNTNVSNADTVTIGDTTYTFVTALTEVFASAVLTNDTVNVAVATPASITLTIDDTIDVADGDTVTIGSVTYRFKDTMAAINDVKRDGTTTATTLNNLIAAINASGTPGVEYFTGTVVNPDAAAGAQASHATLLTANFATAASDALPATETSARLDFAGAGTTFAAGTPRVAGDTVTVGDTTYEFYPNLTGVNNGANRIKQGVDADTSLLNLARAINLGGTPGVEYGTATVVNASATSSATVIANAITLTAISGVAAVGNAIAKAENSAHLDFDGVGAVFTGGVDSVENEVVVSGVDADGSLDALVAAINADAGAGTTYSTATEANAQVTAADRVGHTVTVSSILASGDSIALTTTAATLTWSKAAITDGIAVLKRLVSVVVNPQSAGVNTQLRRHFKSWIEV